MSAHVVKMCYLLAIITSFLGRVMIFTYAGEIESFHLAAPLASKCGKWSLESSRTVELLKRGPLKPNEIFSLHQSLVKCIIFLFLSLKMTFTFENDESDVNQFIHLLHHHVFYRLHCRRRRGHSWEGCVATWLVFISSKLNQFAH